MLASHIAFRRSSPTPRWSSDRSTTAIDRFVDGDDGAFSDVYRALSPRLYRFLLRLTRDALLAEDLVQETFTRMYKARSECRRGAEIMPWACTIARNLFCDHARRAKLQRLDMEEAQGRNHGLAEASPQPDDALAAERMAGCVEEVLARLPAGQTEAFRLVREHGSSMEEAATKLGRTELSVRLSVHRARTAIRAHLAERWGVSA